MKLIVILAAFAAVALAQNATSTGNTTHVSTGNTTHVTGNSTTTTTGNGTSTSTSTTGNTTSTSSNATGVPTTGTTGIVTTGTTGIVTTGTTSSTSSSSSTVSLTTGVGHVYTVTVAAWLNDTCVNANGTWTLTVADKACTPFTADGPFGFSGSFRADFFNSSAVTLTVYDTDSCDHVVLGTETFDNGAGCQKIELVGFAPRIFTVSWTASTGTTTTSTSSSSSTTDVGAGSALAPSLLAVLLVLVSAFFAL